MIRLEIHDGTSYVDVTDKLTSLRHRITGRQLEAVDFELVNTDVHVGQKIRVKRGASIVFEGIIYERRKRQESGVLEVDATAYSELIAYDRHVVYRMYDTGTTAGAIIRDLAGLESDVIVDADDGPALNSPWEIQNETALKIMQSVARGTNYYLRMRPALSYLSFDGVDDRIVVPHSDLLNVQSGNKITIMIWAYLTGWQSGYPVGVLIDKRSESTANYNWQYNSTLMRMRIHANNNLYVVSVPHNLNNLNCYAMVLNGSRLEGYLNGELKASRNDVAATTGNNRNLHIGETISGMFRIAGRIYQVLIYSRPLTADEVERNYDNPDTPITNGLVLWFRFDEGRGDTVYDRSGNNNNGTIYGATWGLQKNPPFANTKLLEFKPKVVA
jgi:hypothetical protein